MFIGLNKIWHHHIIEFIQTYGAPLSYYMKKQIQYCHIIDYDMLEIWMYKKGVNVHVCLYKDHITALGILFDHGSYRVFQHQDGACIDKSELEYYQYCIAECAVDDFVSSEIPLEEREKFIFALNHLFEPDDAGLTKQAI